MGDDSSPMNVSISRGTLQSKFRFTFLISLKGQESLEFCTGSYTTLKKWTLGLNALVSNQKSLKRLSTIICKE